MKSIKDTVRTPFLFLIILFPLAALVLFNAAFRLYFEKNTRDELRAVAGTLETVVRREFGGTLRDLSPSALNGAFVKLYRAINSSKLAVNTQMLLFDRKDDLIYPRDDTQEEVDGAVAAQIQSLLPGMEDRQIVPLRVGGQRYLLLPYRLTKIAGNRPTIVFVAQTSSGTFLIRVINLMLIAVLLVGAGLAAWIAARLSRRIAAPVAQLSGMAGKIGRGNFLLPEPSRGASEISELNTLYQSLREMAARLESADRTQKAFLQNASHELKTPLMSIQGYAEGIAQGVLPDSKSAAQIIEKESMRLGTLVDELLTLSRIENQTYPRELALVSLGDILKEYVQRLGGLAAKLERRLTLHVPDAPVMVWADDMLLSQSVMNVASNGLRYAKSAVQIQLVHERDSAVIRIGADGAGIAKEDLAHIFERFYKGKGGNFGLGLAIARSAVISMGGQIRAYNGETGAVFEITLPLAKEK
jgi:signal transduction histidine kinase